GSMYILDEPSIGLHPRDTGRLVSVMHKLRDAGNTVIVVEHDEDIMRAADNLIDVGPDAGSLGGQIVWSGKVSDIDASTPGHTAEFLTGRDSIPVPASRRKWRDSIVIEGARENNLKNIDAKFPLGVLTAVTGVSGSGKSTLVRSILYPALLAYLYIMPSGDKRMTREFSALKGDLSRISGVELVDQNPLGRSSRSNPATYMKAFDEIRRLFSEQQMSKQMGFKPGYFSFNAEGGRCEECKGDGTLTIEMQFMADITMVCPECGGKRYKREVLEVLYRGKSISDVLDMTVAEAIDFFNEAPDGSLTEKKIVKLLKPLYDVGLGYIKLGQSTSTLSGGESQRLKLAGYFASEKMQPTLFILDEPTTGLHSADISRLMRSLDALVARGHTVIVIEHNLDVIKSADYVIDLGPEGGEAGGNIVAAGTPEEIAANPASLTGAYLLPKLRNAR
ncbi:MAG: ATP-binding cassette domain-containing protein, partial [Paramuribaculum sp.]|nr:ATP-binding cassette domain-containing protein [Paramuribaculum sp.]